MKISTKTQLALIFLALACFIGVVTSLIVNSLVTNQIIFEAQERVKEHLSTARWVYESKVRDINRTIRWTSIRHVLKRGLKEKDISSIKNELFGLMTEEELNFLTLVDRKGTVIFRFHNPKVSGDSLIHDPFVKGALEKKAISGTQVLSGDELVREGESLAQMAIIPSVPTPKERPTKKVEETSGMVLKSAYPVIDFNGEVLGVLTGGVLLNRNYEIVDRIKNIVFKGAKYKGKEIGTATIFLGDLRISTNVMDKEGNRAIGTRAMKEVQEQVLGKGAPWIHRAFVVDDWYITAYEPIQDIQDKIVGMLYVGMMESKYAVMKERLILLFFLFSMTGMLVALTVSFLLSWKILKK
ncbi:MAG: cache domain-containing protein [Desulfobacterales bacterium]|nr:cache domain-containing protein [Desulfobacterales bacterium]